MKTKSKKYILAFLSIVILILSSCYSFREKRYYSNKENYITDKALVKNIIYDEAENTIYLWLSEIDDCYQDNTFKVKGDNATILLEEDILNKVQVGCEIEYISAPEYFGDGYCMPIVAISIAGENLLNFDDGYKNLMNLY